MRGGETECYCWRAWGQKQVVGECGAAWALSGVHPFEKINWCMIRWGREAGRTTQAFGWGDQVDRDALQELGLPGGGAGRGQELMSAGLDMLNWACGLF